MSDSTISTNKGLITKTAVFIFLVLLNFSNLQAAKLLYIFSATDKTDSVQALDFKTLLNSFGHTTILINTNQVTATQLSQYDLIVVSSGSALNSFHWQGDTTSIRLIKTSGKGVIALGKGGTLLFGDMKLWSSWGQSALNGGTSEKIKSSFAPILSSPNSIAIPTDSTLTVGNVSNGIVELYLARGVPNDVIILSLDISNKNYAPMAFEKNKYFFWGFYTPANDLSTAGKNLLQNVISYVLKSTGVTAVNESDEANTIPNKFELNQNYPNPFNPSTIIKYQLPSESFVTIKIYDLLGKEVATLVNENKSAGNYQINFDAGKLTSGMYIYTISANNFVQSKKMLLMK